MSDLKARYPLATADGVAIPNDTIRPAGVYAIPIGDSVGSDEVVLPAGYKTIVLFSNIGCIVKFGGVATQPSDVLQAGAAYLPANTLMTVSPSIMAISGITAIGTGTLFVTLVESWAGLSLELQNSRR